MPPVYGNPNDYNQGEIDIEDDEPYDPNETVQIKPVTDRWASSAGRLAADPGAPDPSSCPSLMRRIVVVQDRPAFSWAAWASS